MGQTFARSMKRGSMVLFAAALAATLVSCQTKSATERVEEALKRQEAERASATSAQKTDAPQPALRALDLPSPYDLREATEIVADGICPTGFWTLFNDKPPGATAEERKQNEALRKERAKALNASTYIVRLRGSPLVSLSTFDAPAGKFVISVAGSVSCRDEKGLVEIAWNTPKAVSTVPKGEVGINHWEAGLETFDYPMASLSEAKAFYEQNRINLSARVAFTLGATTIDHKMEKVARVDIKPDLSVTTERIQYGGGIEDWGAGRLVRAQLIGIRVARDAEKTELFDRRRNKR